MLEKLFVLSVVVVTEVYRHVKAHGTVCHKKVNFTIDNLKKRVYFKVIQNEVFIFALSFISLKH